MSQKCYGATARTTAEAITARRAVLPNVGHLFYRTDMPRFPAVRIGFTRFWLVLTAISAFPQRGAAHLCQCSFPLWFAPLVQTSPESILHAAVRAGWPAVSHHCVLLLLIDRPVMVIMSLREDALMRSTGYLFPSNAVHVPSDRILFARGQESTGGRSSGNAKGSKEESCWNGERSQPGV